MFCLGWTVSGTDKPSHPSRTPSTGDGRDGGHQEGGEAGGWRKRDEEGTRGVKTGEEREEEQKESGKVGEEEEGGGK